MKIKPGKLDCIFIKDHPTSPSEHSVGVVHDINGYAWFSVWVKPVTKKQVEKSYKDNPMSFDPYYS